jgi:Xaa-Pro dipeptidase
VTSLDRLRAWLASQGLETAWISNPVSIAYLSGFRADPGERLMALALSAETATLVVPALEAEHAEARVREIEVVGWLDGQDGYALLRRLLGDTRRLAVEKSHLTLAAAERVVDSGDFARLRDVGEEVRRLRLVKAPAELELLARAASATDRVTAAVMSALAPGQSEREIASRIAELASAEGGALSFPPLVQSGPNSALPHLTPSSRKLERGDLLLLDFGVACEGYNGDTTRRAVLGAPDERLRGLYDVVLKAHDTAIAAVRPGATAGAIDAAARSVIASAGLADRFIHRVGHGLGLEVHEDPSLDPGSGIQLEEGMVFTIEPGVYLPGWGGIRIEDDVVVEASGARLLTAAGRELVVVSAT